MTVLGLENLTMNKRNKKLKYKNLALIGFILQWNIVVERIPSFSPTLDQLIHCWACQLNFQLSNPTTLRLRAFSGHWSPFYWSAVSDRGISTPPSNCHPMNDWKIPLPSCPLGGIALRCMIYAVSQNTQQNDTPVVCGRNSFDQFLLFPISLLTAQPVVPEITTQINYLSPCLTICSEVSQRKAIPMTHEHWLHVKGFDFSLCFLAVCSQAS